MMSNQNAATYHSTTETPASAHPYHPQPRPTLHAGLSPDRRLVGVQKGDHFTAGRSTYDTVLLPR
jgi:hypothetical protein